MIQNLHDRKFVMIAGIKPDEFPHALIVREVEEKNGEFIIRAVRPVRSYRKRTPMDGDRVRIHWPEGIQRIHGKLGVVKEVSKSPGGGTLNYSVLLDGEKRATLFPRELIRFADQEQSAEATSKASKPERNFVRV